jgi:hypothetical protein
MLLITSIVCMTPSQSRLARHLPLHQLDTMASMLEVRTVLSWQQLHADRQLTMSCVGAATAS